MKQIIKAEESKYSSTLFSVKIICFFPISVSNSLHLLEIILYRVLVYFSGLEKLSDKETFLLNQDSILRKFFL